MPSPGLERGHFFFVSCHFDTSGARSARLSDESLKLQQYLIAILSGNEDLQIKSESLIVAKRELIGSRGLVRGGKLAIDLDYLDEVILTAAQAIEIVIVVKVGLHHQTSTSE